MQEDPQLRLILGNSFKPGDNEPHLTVQASTKTNSKQTDIWKQVLNHSHEKRQFTASKRLDGYSVDSRYGVMPGGRRTNISETDELSTKRPKDLRTFVLNIFTISAVRHLFKEHSERT